MASTQSFHLAALGSLVGAIAGTPTGHITTDNQFRRYRSGLTIGVHEQGTYTYSRRSIFYEIGRRTGRLREALDYTKADDSIMLVDASVKINPAQAANFEGWARKFSNFSPQWEMMDLAGVVERLAKAVATESVFGGVNCTNLRAAQPIRVVALGTLDSPQTASVNSVFIPRTVDTVGNDHVFAVLAAAANGEGSAVTTDVLRLDAGTNQPILPDVQGHALAQACVEALRILGANYEESGASDVFVWALTRGIHSVMSVVAHTDEGGWFRSVMRTTTFRPPYGGINQALRAYPALPPLAGTSAGFTSSWVDAVSLKTAALVAHCDPCTIASGGVFPTVFTSNSGDISPPGTGEQDSGAADARAIGRQISADISRFAPIYIQGLLKLFGLSSNSGVGESLLSSAAGQALYDTQDRHLQHKTVAPYFWIEPTSLIPHDFLGSIAEAAGFGALTSPGQEVAKATFEKVRELDRGHHANFCTIAFKMRTARTSGLVSAYASKPDNLAGIKLYQFDEDSIVLAGDQGPTNGDVPTKHAAADPLSSYLWVRGQSAIPAPAEFINTQSAYAAKYKIVEWDDDFAGDIQDIPEPWELESHPTLWRTSVPTALAAGPSNAGDSNARRARSRAAIALQQAVIRSRGLGDAASPVIAVSNVPPALDDTPQAKGAEEGQYLHNYDPGRTQVLGQGNARAPQRDVRGAPLMPVPHHQPLRGAPYPRVGGGIVGGGGPVAPPPPPPQGPAGQQPPHGPNDQPAEPPVPDLNQEPVLPPADEQLAAGALPVPAAQ